MTVAISQNYLDGFVRLMPGEGWTNGQPFREATVQGVEANYLGKVRSGACLILQKVRDGVYAPFRAIFRGKRYSEADIPALELTGEFDELLATVGAPLGRWNGLEKHRPTLIRLAKTPLRENAEKIEDDLLRRISAEKNPNLRMRLEIEFDSVQTARALKNPSRYLFGSNSKFSNQPGT